VRSGRYVVAAAIFVAAIVGALLIYYRMSQPAHAPATYGWRIEYSEFPADDLALEDWLRSQEGVHITTLRREGNTLMLTYTRHANLPPLDILAECERLGYKGRGSFSGGGGNRVARF
jgi:hypothetical protein